MRIAVIGSGNVGMSLANGFAAGGHGVAVGTRDASKPSLGQWVAAGRLALGYREATEWGELVCLAVPGRLVRQTVLDIGPAAFGDKIVIDVTNPVLITEDSVEAAYGEDSSAAEVVQAALPDARVVKAFNQIEATQMLAPDTSKGPRHMRICGNDQAAKAFVAELLAPYGWEVPDLGGIGTHAALRPPRSSGFAASEAEAENPNLVVVDSARHLPGACVAQVAQPQPQDRRPAVEAAAQLRRVRRRRGPCLRALSASRKNRSIWDQAAP